MRGAQDGAGSKVGRCRAMADRDHDLRDVSTHFAFGRNWASFARSIGEAEIREAERGLQQLLAAEDIAGCSLIDIGCGSGLHALAAVRIGADRVLAVDLDPESVATARAVLERHGASEHATVLEANALALEPAVHGTFDIVYSWGVLHHTGAMWEAVERAAGLVAPGGQLVLALYRSTRFDGFWMREKRWYKSARPWAQKLARGLYIGVYRSYLALKRQNFRTFVANYRSARGMDFYHDVHDWLGGYPYETTLAPEVDRRLATLGFEAERVFAGPRTRGLLGSGCDEYVYRRRPAGATRG